jgi:hypothetical protein
MISMTIRPFVLMFLFAFFAADGSAAELKVSPDYLEGKWVLGEKQSCGSAEADYVIMRRNGTVEMGQGEKVRILGFWELNNDTLTLHMLVSPKGTKTQNPFYRESYRYQYIAAQVLETRQDSFDVFTGTSVEGGKQTLTRCP